MAIECHDSVCQRRVCPMTDSVGGHGRASSWCSADELCGLGGEERCPACGLGASAIFCRLCVRSGEFSHSADSADNCFSALRQQLFRLRHELVACAIAVEDGTEASRARGLLAQRRVRARRRRSALVEAVQAARERVHDCRQRLESARLLSRRLRQRRPVVQQRVSELRRLAESGPGSQQRLSYRLAAQRRHLSDAVDTSLTQLVSLVFPIVHLVADSAVSSPPSTPTERALCEAQSLSHVHGRWVRVADAERQRYRVVAPTLPASGDYSAFAVWSGSDGIGVLSHPLHNLVAGLQHVAQLSVVMAACMRVRLPNRLCYSEFGCGALSESEFAGLAARLNANVLFLCVSRGVDVSRLVARRTVSNVLLLVAAAARGQPPRRVLHSPLIDALEESLRPDLDRDRQEEEQEDGRRSPTPADEAEWEEVPLGVPTAVLDPACGTESTSVATALVSTAAASVASFFRGLNR